MKAIITDTYVSFIVDGKQVKVDSNDVGYNDVIEAIKTNNEQLLVDVANNRFNLKKTLYTKVFGDVVTLGDDGTVQVDGHEISGTLANRIRAHAELGLSLEPLVNFYRKVRENPSSRSQSELFDFLEGKNLPLDNDGDFYAYKAVNNLYYSKRGGKVVLVKGMVNDQGQILNSPGEYIQCERASVDDDRGHTCSHGLHVGGLDYATVVYYKPGDKVVIVKVNPKDVVSVPKDYNAQKLRTCAYAVVEDYTGPLPDYTLDQYDDYYDEDDYDEDYEDEEEEELVSYKLRCCGGSCGSNDVRPRRGDIISFVCQNMNFKDIVVCDVVGNQVFGGSSLGFGSWNTSEMQNLQVSEK